ncbi:MAG: serine/threonine-protein kinase RsbW [Solirubrobacteraceae bacterium]|nr:serine/threonine-protein kinase RsbW [Solirubrobacteraceae bacterium]
MGRETARSAPGLVPRECAGSAPQAGLVADGAVSTLLRAMQGVTTTVPRTSKQSFAVRAEPGAIAQARERVIALAEPFIDPERIGDLRLVISEVVTNAVRHGGEGDMLLAVTPKQEFLCVQVTDTGDGFAPRPRACAPDEDGGFGLFLIERLTRRWGLTRENSNTRVWFEFDFQPQPAAQAA